MVPLLPFPAPLPTEPRCSLILYSRELVLAADSRGLVTELKRAIWMPSLLCEPEVSPMPFLTFAEFGRARREALIELGIWPSEAFTEPDRGLREAFAEFDNTRCEVPASGSRANLWDCAVVCRIHGMSHCASIAETSVSMSISSAMGTRRLLLEDDVSSALDGTCSPRRLFDFDAPRLGSSVLGICAGIFVWECFDASSGASVCQAALGVALSVSWGDVFVSALDMC